MEHNTDDMTARRLLHRYLEDRGFNGWNLIAELGEGARLVGHKEGIELCRFTLKYPPKPGLFGLWIPYPGCGNYGSVRWLNPTKKMAKLLCPAQKNPPVYIPEGLKPGKDLYICESVLKAMTLTLLGFPAIAGNGVNGVFTNNGFPSNFPNHLIDGADRVLILFDSDVVGNKNVELAGQRLALGLKHKWGHIDVIQKTLPKPPAELEQENWGVDDFHAHYGKEALLAWLGGDHCEVPFDLGLRGRHLMELHVKYAVCKSPVGVVCFESGNVYKTNDFKTTIEAQRHYLFNDKRQYAAKEYIEWDDRNVVSECRYHPGRPAGFIGDLFNKWRDTGVEAVEGDISLFEEFVYNAIPRGADALLMLQMWAWGLQNRGCRWEKCLMLVSTTQSTGKSTLGRILAKCYGSSNYSSIDPDSFTKDFNGMYMEREIVMLDEVMRMDRKAYAKLERIVTDDQLDVNVKYGDQYMTDNYLNVVLTSNDPACVELKDAERRMFALEVTPTVYHPQGDPYWGILNDWLEGGGYGHIRYWLENMDLTGFNPRFLPPRNPMKDHMLDVGVDDITNWCRDLREDVSGIMLGSTRQFFTPEEILEVYLMGQDIGAMQKRSIKGKMGMALSMAGFKKANGGDPVTMSGAQGRSKLRFWDLGTGVGTGVPPNAANIRADYEKDPLFMTRIDPIGRAERQ